MSNDEMNGGETVTPLVYVCTIVMFLSAIIAGAIEHFGGEGSVLWWIFLFLTFLPVIIIGINMIVTKRGFIKYGDYYGKNAIFAGILCVLVAGIALFCLIMGYLGESSYYTYIQDRCSHLEHRLVRVSVRSGVNHCTVFPC